MQDEVFVVEFEDGTTVEVRPKPKDLARAELAGFDFQQSGPIAATYAAAWAALRRLERSGTLPEGVTVPESIDAFLDACDVGQADTGEVADDEGEVEGREATSG